MMKHIGFIVVSDNDHSFLDLITVKNESAVIHSAIFPHSFYKVKLGWAESQEGGNVWG